MLNGRFLLGVFLHQKLCLFLKLLIDGQVLPAVGQPVVLFVFWEKIVLDLSESLIANLLKLIRDLVIWLFQFFDILVLYLYRTAQICDFLLLFGKLISAVRFDSLNFFVFFSELIVYIFHFDDQTLDLGQRVKLTLRIFLFISQLDNLGLSPSLVGLVLSLYG